MRVSAPCLYLLVGLIFSASASFGCLVSHVRGYVPLFCEISTSAEEVAPFRGSWIGLREDIRFEVKGRGKIALAFYVHPQVKGDWRCENATVAGNRLVFDLVYDTPTSATGHSTWTVERRSGALDVTTSESEGNLVYSAILVPGPSLAQRLRWQGELVSERLSEISWRIEESVDSVLGLLIDVLPPTLGAD